MAVQRRKKNVKTNPIKWQLFIHFKTNHFNHFIRKNKSVHKEFDGFDGIAVL